MKKGLIFKLLLLQVLLSVGQPPARNRTSLPVHMFEGNGSCPTQQDRETIHNQILSNITSITSSLELPPATYSCGGTTGWRRVGYLDMTDPSQSCPPGLALKYYSPGLRSCGRATNDIADNCWSTFYTTGTSQYSRVCGRVRGYQFGAAGAFTGGYRGIDHHYVHGVSLTHGQVGNRVHIWTFAGGLSEVDDGRLYYFHFCPCVLTTNAPQPPAFVGNDYFCESGFNSAWVVVDEYILYPADPLWDGQNCATSTCCQFNNPPYFTKTLPAPTTDDIELRICVSELGNFVFLDVPIDQVELFVQ